MKEALHQVLILVLALSIAAYAALVVLPSFAHAPEEAAIITAEEEEANISVPVAVPMATTTGNEYIEIVNSCDWSYSGEPCVNLRSGPGTDYGVVTKLRNNVVLKVATTTVVDGEIWYKIGFDGEIHYPERIGSDWYVNATDTRAFYDVGELATSTKAKPTNDKRIVVDIARQTLYAYDGDTLFMQLPVSTGLDLTPTAVGRYSIYRKMPDSYMQGPVPGLSDQYYDLPGVPWDLYFTPDGGAIHGTYWHNHFGEKWSHGCVNLPAAQAETLYYWADLGTPVTVES